MSELTEVKDDFVHYFVDNLGRKQGECKEWWAKGQLWEHCYHKDGWRHGEYKLWNADGQMRAHRFYNNGKYDKECRMWYKCGQPRIYRIYADGVKHGEYKYWKKNGVISQHKFYSYGVDITNEVSILVNDISNISSEDRLLIKLRFDIDCLAVKA